SAYSVLTDGRIFPVSICEIELGERSSRLASSRSPMAWRRRIARSRGPSSDALSEPPEPAALALSGRSVLNGWELCPSRDPSSSPSNLAVDQRRGDDQEALEDVLPLLVEV